MELSRAEREATKPINWGLIFYERQLLNDKNQSFKERLIKTRVRSALEQHSTEKGPLDGSKLIQQMNDEDLCELFAQYPKCSIFYLKSWNRVSETVLRCISMSFSENLTELDLSESQVLSTHLELLLVRCSRLKIIRLNQCQNVDVNAISSVVKLLHRSLEEIYLKDCPLIKQEPLLWIGGAAGPSKQSLKLLRCLDLSLCPIIDAGFMVIPRACTRLQFLNLQDCAALTDESILQVGRHCRRLQLLNLSGCQLLTDKAVSSVGSGCGGLVSLNISRCVKISDKGVRAIATGCVSLQAVNLAGLVRITEEALLFLASRCQGLLMLNLTGCERVTVVGLDHLIRGLHFVENAVSFMGFKPVDEHVARKLEGHLLMLECVAETQLSGAHLEQQAKSEAKAEEESRRINSAATLMQSYMHRYKLRMHFYNLWQRRLRSEKAVLLQRVYRGHLGRRRASRRREELKLYLSLAPFAIRIQRNVRGYLCRIVHTKSSRLIREMYFNRKKEAESGLAVRLQAHARRYLAALRVSSWRELTSRRALNMDHAATTMQLLARMFVSKVCVKRRRQQLKEELEARDDASIKIKIFLLTRMRRFKSKLTGDAFRIFYRRKWAAITEVQRLYRGFAARERVHKIKIDLSARHFAATIIQKYFRGSRVLHWRDMRLNVIAAYVLDRQYLERRGAVEASRLRYKQFVEDNQRDSASEPDDELPEEEKWEKLLDKAKKMHYWINYATNYITYDEPPQPFAHEHGFIGKRIKVFWIVQGVWYEGQVTRYHRRKRRHRVEYDDGDHEWMDLAAEGDRVQLQMDDGTWAMYVMYVSETQLNEQRKQQERLQRNQFKQQAFKDAQQWKMFVDDRRGEIMFISTVSGQLRSGLPNAADWVVQDDGFGFPCFYNLQTEAVVYEDPRFVYDVDEDVAVQRQYVMQEVRYAMYFCKDLWEDFEKATTSQGQERQIRQAMLAVVNSPKIDHLNSFVIRAKALYKQVSVVDKPMDEAIHLELEYAGWLSQRLAETRDHARIFLQQRLEKGRQIMAEIKIKTVQSTQLHCRFCNRPTQRHLEFCATCGKRQVFL